MQREDQKWPDVLWIVRHGESAGNVARQQAYLSQQPLIDIALRWSLPEPDAQGDKRTRGMVVCVGGSAELPGAAVLAGTAALRAGAGTVRRLPPAPRSSFRPWWFSKARARWS
jgi:NAD(P)H-hydrate repair Nnr-like enzyme with NAD(P)H-hydrate dehydratase domain